MIKGARGVVRYGFKSFLATHFVVRFNQNHNCTVPYFYDYMCGAMQCGLEFSQNHNCTASYFCGHMYSMVNKIRFELFEVGLFFKFWPFSTQLKLIFPFLLNQILNY